MSHEHFRSAWAYLSQKTSFQSAINWEQESSKMSLNLKPITPPPLKQNLQAVTQSKNPFPKQTLLDLSGHLESTSPWGTCAWYLMGHLFASLSWCLSLQRMLLGCEKTLTTDLHSRKSSDGNPGTGLRTKRWMASVAEQVVMFHRSCCRDSQLSRLFF